ncbi:sigma-54 interaction domain family [Haematococcus lacustris]
MAEERNSSWAGQRPSWRACTAKHDSFNMEQRLRPAPRAGPNPRIAACQSFTTGVAAEEASFEASRAVEEEDAAACDDVWLARWPPWSYLPAPVLQAMVKLAKPMTVNPGQVVAHAGGVVESLLIIRDGCLTQQRQGLGAVPGAAGAEGAAAGEEAGQGVLGPGAVAHFQELVLGAAPSLSLSPSPPQGARTSATGRRAQQADAQALAPATLVAQSSRCRVWLVPALEFKAHVRSHLPDYTLALSRWLLDQMQAAASQALGARARGRALLPYLVPAPKQGVVGSSTYSDRLRKQVVAAARDPRRAPLLVFGEPGVGKCNLAALVHYGSAARNTPLVRLSCERLDSQGAELFGRGSKPGLLQLLCAAAQQPGAGAEEAPGGSQALPGAAAPLLLGTLLLDNAHKLPPPLIPKLVQLLSEGTWSCAPGLAEAEAGAGNGAARPLQSSQGVRIILTSERHLPALEAAAQVIKVPPLRLRTTDIPNLVAYFLAQASRSHAPKHDAAHRTDQQIKGGQAGGAALASPRPLKLTLSAEAVRRLQAMGAEAGAGAGAGAAAAVLVAPSVQVQQVSEELVWFGAQARERLRVDLLAVVPGLRSALRSDLWPEAINFKFTAYVFPVVVALLLCGPQDRDHNVVMNVFWAMWWPGIFIVYPFLGRVWCAVCPFMIYGELVQRWRLASGAQLAKWPKATMEVGGPWFLTALFAAILVWEQVWDLPNSAWLSGWLLLLITAGAMLFSSLFERRLWCRYLCPIGGMNGLFAKGSVLELRARQGVCAGSCSTYGCYKGGPAAPPDGQDTTGCPLYSHPAQLQDNKNCTLCMTCLKACPHKSVQLRLRLPGAELWEGSHQGTWAELALLLMLLGAVPLHTSHLLAEQLGLAPDLFTGINYSHILASLAVLAAPGLLAVAADAGGRLALSRLQQRAPAPLKHLGYGYLPLVWAATLAHYEKPLLSEAGRVLQVAGAMVGWSASSDLPYLAAHPAVIAFIQGSTLLLGTAAALALTRKLGGVPWSSLLPQTALITLACAELWVLNIT